MVKEIDLQVHEAQRIPNKMDAKRATPRYIIIKVPSVTNKERIWMEAQDDTLCLHAQSKEGQHQI